MKKIIKRILLILVLIVAFLSIYKFKEILHIENIFSADVKTDDYNILKTNLEKEAKSNPKAQWLYENFDSLETIEQNLIGNDDDTIDFVYNYENNINDFQYEIGESKNYGRSTPYYLQWDNRWAYNPLGSSIIGFAGCGPTSMAMVLSRLEDDPSISPLTIAEDAHNYMGENGISWKFFTDEAYKYNRNIDNIPINEENMINALKKGPLIVSVGPGNFTLAGHILVIDSYSNNKFVINDPNSLKNSERTWSYNQLEKQIVNIWLIY
ncbi:MAG: C39 family peptidase [Anaerococcus sp.]